MSSNMQDIVASMNLTSAMFLVDINFIDMRMLVDGFRRKTSTGERTVTI